LIWINHTENYPPCSNQMPGKDLNYTNIVTSFLKNHDKILILKRSDKVKSMKSLWAGISGIIEKDDLSPLSRAEIEIFEETGIKQEQINLLKESQQMKIVSLNIKIMNGIFFHSYSKLKIQKLNLIGKILSLNG